MSTEARAHIPFVDFYRELNISPVSQDISDLEKHYSRRESLYRLLGITPKLVRDLDVLELCPGSGYNSIYTQSLLPHSYTLVDANLLGLNHARDLFARYHPDAHIIFEHKMIEDYNPRKIFDLVICEGAIPFQLDPPAFAQNISRFVDEQGLLIVTTVDAVSAMGECVRRLLASRISPLNASADTRLSLLRTVFSPHLATLKGASRPIDDWILDNIIQPYTGKLFSIPDAIRALAGKGFEILGSSPQFSNEWRWYKDLTREKVDWNERAAGAYLGNVLNFLDYRFVRPAHDHEFGLLLISECDAFHKNLQRYENGDESAFSSAIDCLGRIIGVIGEAAPETAAALQEALDAMQSTAIGAHNFTNFHGFFGRGQQYVSFIRAQPGN